MTLRFKIKVPFFLQNAFYHLNCLKLLNFQIMHQHCHCYSNQNERGCSKSQLQTQIRHTIKLFQDNYISPYKILYMLQPTQADNFKVRNKSNGCCSSNHITIADSQLTKTEKKLKQLISEPNLLKHLNQILQGCSQKHKNIIQNGKKDKLQINDQVDKFILDKVIAQFANHFILCQLKELISNQTRNRGKEIGLWATPATWKQRYPDIDLNFLPSVAISQLINQGWSVVKSFAQNTQNLIRECQILQKDGKFQERPWNLVQSSQKVVLKVLSNFERFLEIKNVQNEYFFPQLRQTSIFVNSIPFELNAKANLFCTVSPSLHICYGQNQFKSMKSKESIRYTALVIIEGEVSITILGQNQKIASGDLMLIDNNRSQHQIESLSKQLFILRSFIQTAEMRK